VLCRRVKKCSAEALLYNKPTVLGLKQRQLPLDPTSFLFFMHAPKNL